jgi:hypothetical protein
MRILFISHRFPYPPNRGGKIRPFQMIRHLGKKHEVMVASLAFTHQELDQGKDLGNYCAGVLSDVLPNRKRWINAGLSLVSTTPSSVAYFQSSTLLRKVREASRKQGFDGVIVHCAFMAPYAAQVRARFRILDYGDLDSGKWSDYAQFRSFPISWGYALESGKLRRFERRMADFFDFCTVTTAGERDEFLGLGLHKPNAVIPNGVDSQYFRRETQDEALSPTIVFLGRMDYYPNVEGITWFAREVYPRVRSSVPQVTLRIIGSEPVRPVRELARMPGVVVTGYVVDVRPHLRDASVAVAPLHIARGTQNKILECMAMGLPVVCTPQAARGVEAVPGEHLLVADRSEEFAAKVSDLLQDTHLRRRIATAGAKQVRACHQWENSMKMLDRVLEQVAGGVA